MNEQEQQREKKRTANGRVDKALATLLGPDALFFGRTAGAGMLVGAVACVATTARGVSVVVFHAHGQRIKRYYDRDGKKRGEEKVQ